MATPTPITATCEWRVRVDEILHVYFSAITDFAYKYISTTVAYVLVMISSLVHPAKECVECYHRTASRI